MFSHGYLPPKLMETIIIPIIKKIRRALLWIKTIIDLWHLPVVSRIIELILLHILHDKLGAVCNQFGFKSKHGTDMCVILAKTNCRVL